MYNRKMQKAFTLVELAIVIVIIGLIIAGVIAGQTLVNQARLRSIVNDQNIISIAINSFRLKYDALPGDFAMAYNYWGMDCADTQQSCNGDGNREIQPSIDDAGDSEVYRSWQHLKLSGLYKGDFTGEGLQGAPLEGDIAVNIPSSRFPDVGVTLIHDNQGAVSDIAFPPNSADIGNVMIFGGERANSIAVEPRFDADEAQSIDSKIDDGNPLKGRMFGGGEDCVDPADNDLYQLGGGPDICNIVFELTYQ